MKKINFKKDRIPFTQVANQVLFDKNLSAKSKGLYAYLYAKPEGWDFAIDRIALEMSDGRKSINSGLHELEANGYLIRERKDTGRVVYILKSQMPQMDMGVEKPHAPNGQVPKRPMAETGTVSNKDKVIIKSNTNKEKALSIGEFNNIKILPTEIVKLEDKLGREYTQELLEELSNYIASSGKKYKSHYATILAWARRKNKPVYKKSVTFIKHD